MSDQDIIDTIAGPLREYAIFQLNHLPGYGDDPDAEQVLSEVELAATGIAEKSLAALRGAGYEIVTTEEAKLKSLENQPPSAPAAAEADQ